MASDDTTNAAEESASAELIFGLVAPLGVDLEFATQRIQEVLTECNYLSSVIRLSEFLHEECCLWQGNVPGELDEYIEIHQHVGDLLRDKTQRQDALALAALLMINRARLQFEKDKGALQTRRAYIIRQLKTPAEVELLRNVYGERFVLIGIYAHLKRRITALAKKIAKSRDGSNIAYTKYEQRARDLIETDDSEPSPFGQNVRDTFPLSDLFVALNDPNEESFPEFKGLKFADHIRRFTHLILGKPDCVPSPEEFLMFQARAVSLFSGDRSRQVGAVIATRDGSVIAVGRNDDPKVGGGVIAAAGIAEEEDPSSRFKVKAVEEVVAKLSEWLSPEIRDLNSKERIAKAMDKLEKTQLVSSGQFGRMVHAEMAAIMDAAMRGVAVKDQVMFCTTFPCENCAKHLMAAGIRVLVHIEPYPKSLVVHMYEREIDQNPMLSLASNDLSEELESSPKRFLLQNYLGVAPRLYMQLFTMPRRKDAKGSKIRWNQKSSSPRVGSAIIAHEYSRWELKEAVLLKSHLKADSAFREA